jgi:hypothetical protein
VVIARRKAIVGYAMYLIARRVARRQIRRRLSGLRPTRLTGLRPTMLRDGEDGDMLKRTKGARAAADRAGTVVEAVRPIVTRAMHDPELHTALRRAFATGREVSGEISGKPPRKAAKKLAQDKRLHRKLEASAQDLQRAVSSLIERPRRKRRAKKFLRAFAIVGAVGGALVLVMRRLRGGSGGGDEDGAS